MHDKSGSDNGCNDKSVENTIIPGLAIIAFQWRLGVKDNGADVTVIQFNIGTTQCPMSGKREELSFV